MDTDDECELRKVRVPKGTHLSKSKDTDGAERDLLREDGTNKLLGPTESIPVDEDEIRTDFNYEGGSSSYPGQEQRTLGQALIQGLIEGVKEADVDWAAVYEDRVGPALRRKREAIVRRLRRRDAPVDDLPVLHGDEVDSGAATGHEQSVEERQPAPRMTEATPPRDWPRRTAAVILGRGTD